MCAPKKAQNVRRLLEGGLTYQLDQGRSCVHLVITEPAEFRSYKESAKALADFMHHGLNRWYSRSTDGPLKRIPYVAVPELQDRGAPHWHLNLAGLCAPWDHKRSLSDFEFDGPIRSGSLCRFFGLEGVAVSRSQTLLPMLAHYGFGVQQGRQLRQIGADGSDARGVAGYMSKGLGAYMSKAVGTGRALPKGASMVRGSKGAAAWWPGHSLESIRDDARKWSMLSRSQEGHRAEIPTT